MLAIASVGLPSGSSKSASSSSSSDISLNSKKETLCVYDASTGNKISSHRMEGPVTSGLTASPEHGVVTSRKGKATIATFAFGKEAPLLRFAAPEELGPMCFSAGKSNIILCSHKISLQRLIVVSFRRKRSKMTTFLCFIREIEKILPASKVGAFPQGRGKPASRIRRFFPG
jgi:hypothetical protein